MNSLPLSLYLKSRVIGSPFESTAAHIRRLAGLSFRLRHPDLWEIQAEEKRLPVILSKLFPPTANCIDVGCHIGSFLSMVLKLFPDGKHLAIEASKTKAEWLKQKFQTTTIYNVAAGEITGTALFEENLKAPGLSRLLGPSSKTADKSYYEVQVRRLDDLVPTDPMIDLLKIDVEGAELLVMKGAVATITRCHPVILFESGAEQSMRDQNASRKDLFDFLTGELGYSIYTYTDFLFEKGPLSFDEFRKCGLYPFRAFNFVAIYHAKSQSIPSELIPKPKLYRQQIPE
jgi:FkbM family methyltransferase